ncbi:N2227-like protein, partial [Periconia macrospinosa]
TATADDCSTARACIRGLFRDWSLEGAAERAASHVPILNALREEFGSRRDKGAVRVLIPGYGLGRLVHSISEIGLSVEGIDVSYHTLLACLYMFGGGSHGVPRPLCPWALSFSNHISRQHQLRRVAVPDLYLDWPIRVGQQPSKASAEQHVVFRRGGFCETYGGSTQAGKFSALVTCYFIDTAPNFLEYVNTAWDCLEAGAIWINIGPLLWNIEENGPAGNGEGDTDGQEMWKARNERLDYTGATLELTAEEVLGLLRAKGFAIERATDNIGPSTYVGNDLGMLRYIYDMAFWVARK